ncbi:MAG: hypothetical protein A4E54_01882 [Pelotomaculum sp. PtaB.Bin117]|nr:MAG: hypothetical protein A4E54_01882 [Pelotomaculum sp. PtaB.Bin117]OPY61980.1 MAG: hypothetical protein A4E56_01692 [Pelotomaculum sp. PtaU1.Bin065]
MMNMTKGSTVKSYLTGSLNPALDADFIRMRLFGNMSSTAISGDI